MKQINHKELKEFVKLCYAVKQPIFVWGASGIGKSESVKAVADELKIQFIDTRLSNKDPTDLKGLPRVDGETTKWIPPDFLPHDKNSKGILFLDEYNLADDSVQKAGYQLILDRRLDNYQLPAGWLIVSAGNRGAEDRANTFDMSAPLCNRFAHLELKIPTLEDWQEWGLKNDVDSRVIAFLNFKRSRLFDFDTKNKDKSFPTPRSWAFTSKLISGIPDKDLDKISIAVASCVGEATAIEFEAFLKIKKKVDVTEILKNPEIVKTYKIDMKYAVLSSLADYYKAHKKTDVLDNICAVVKNLEPEFGYVLLLLIKRLDSRFTENILECKNWRELSGEYTKYV